MEKQFTREEIMERLKTVEHPEISKSLIELGMIMDVGIEQKKVNVAIALPMLNIPDIVRDAIVTSIAGPLHEMGLEIEPIYFEMSPGDRENFFTVAKANWKGPIQ